jgi:hypothetical protein
MRKILALVAILYSAVVFAQSSPPVVEVKPRGGAPRPESIVDRLQACLEIDDATKDRLNCYDAIFPPKPKPKAPVAKGVADCRFIKEEDERLKCFNGFAGRLPKPSH